MNQEQLSAILTKSIANQTPLYLSKTTEMAECLDKVGKPTFTDKEKHDWKVMNGRQLKLTLLSFPELTNEINKVHEISPIDYNIITVTLQNIQQLVSDVAYSDVAKSTFLAPLHLNERRIEDTLKRLANKDVDTDFIEMMITRSLSDRIPFNFLYKYPVAPSMDRLITAFRYYDDVKDADKAYDFE